MVHHITEIECDFCQNVFRVDRTFTKTQVHRAGYAEGWRYVELNERPLDMCPTCVGLNASVMMAEIAEAESRGSRGNE
jgi:hypothetical protein